MGQQRGRQHLGEVAWRELLRRFDMGDESVDAFCRREGVSKSTFNRWRSRGMSAESATTSVATMPKAKSATAQAGFVDLGALCPPMAGASRLEFTLDLGGGVTLHVVRG